MSGSDCNWTQFDVRRSDRGTVLWTQTVPVVQRRPARAVYCSYETSTHLLK